MILYFKGFEHLWARTFEMTKLVLIVETVYCISTLKAFTTNF